MDLFKFSTYTEIQLADILGESICKYSTTKENYLYSQEDRFPVGTEGEATAVAVTKNLALLLSNLLNQFRRKVYFLSKIVSVFVEINVLINMQDTITKV